MLFRRAHKGVGYMKIGQRIDVKEYLTKINGEGEEHQVLAIINTKYQNFVGKILIEQTCSIPV
jgi:hypothetical protein